MELVLGDGSERDLTDGDLLRAARVGLGALGVVAAVTLRCVPSFRLHGVDALSRSRTCSPRSTSARTRTDHFESGPSRTRRWRCTRTNTRTEAPRHAPGRNREWLGDVLVDNHVFGLLNRVARLSRARFPRSTARWRGPPPSASASTGRSASSPARGSCASSRWSTPSRASAPPTRSAATREILERHPVSFPIELRFTAADDALLSPAHGRDCAYVAVHLFEGMAWEAPFREVEALMSAASAAARTGASGRSWARTSWPARSGKWDLPGSAGRARPGGPVRERVGSRRVPGLKTVFVRRVTAQANVNCGW